MSDRLYTRIQRDGKTVYPTFDMQIDEQSRDVVGMVVRVEEQDPHPEGSIPLPLPPFYVDPQTFYGVSGRLMELDKLRKLTDKRMAGNMHVIPSLDQAATRHEKQWKKDAMIVDLTGYSEGEI